MRCGLATCRLATRVTIMDMMQGSQRSYPTPTPPPADEPETAVGKWPVVVAWAIAGLTLLLMFGSIVFSFLSRTAVLPEENNIAREFSPYGRIIWLLGFSVAPIVGALIASRQPNHAYGWIWLVFSLGFGGISNFVESYAIYSFYVVARPLPLFNITVPVAAYGFLLGLALLPFLLLLFPTGRLLTPRWRIVAWITVAAALLSSATAWAIPGENDFLPLENPFALPGGDGLVAAGFFNLGVLIMFAMILFGVASLLLRFRRSHGVEREQIKWFVFAATVWIAAFVQQFFWEFPGIWDNVEEALTMALLPIAIGVAILRYRLYDIDVIIRRTLVYTVLTIILGLVYLVSVVILQGVFAQRVFTAMVDQDSPLVVVLSTLLIAALFTPVRYRTQEVIDRRFYRRKYDAEQTLAEFAATARNEVELDALAAELVRVVKETMQPEHVSLWLLPVQTAARYDE